jgi:hypothetical protein
VVGGGALLARPSAAQVSAPETPAGQCCYKPGESKPACCGPNWCSVSAAGCNYG